MSLLPTSTPEPGQPTGETQQAGTPQTSDGFVNADGSFTQGWTDRLPDDLAGARTTVAKYSNVADLAKGYHHLSQLLGSKANAVTVPGPDAKPEEIASFRKAIGVPEKLEDYQFKPGQIPEGVEWDDNAAKVYGEVAHKLGIPPSAMAALAEVQMQQELGRAQKAQEAHEQAIEAAKTELKGEFGGKFGPTLERVAALVQESGIDPQSPGFADPNVIRVLARLSDKIPREDRTPSGAHAAAGASDYKDIMTNPANPLHQKFRNGDPATHELVKKLIERSL